MHDVLLSHPSRVLCAYQAALAFQEHDLLRAFETGFYYKESRMARALLGVLPQGIAKRINRELYRRVQAGLRPELVHCQSFRDFIFTVSTRLFGPSALSEALMLWRNKHFDSAVAARLLKNPPAAVYCYDTTALLAFQACGRTGTLKILDQVIGHYKVGVELMIQERALHPEFADSIEFRRSETAERRTVEEALAADYIMAPSEYVKQTLLDIGCAAERITVLPYGVDVDRFTPGPPHRQKPFQILFAGLISQRKGIKYLLEAFKHLRLPNAELVLLGSIAGSGRGLRPYEGLFKHLPSVPYAQLHTYYQQADLLVLPSLHEGSALVIYEALAAGLPVITTPNAGSVVRDGEEGYIVPIRDVALLEDRILRLYRDPELRASMAHKARQRAELFTWAAYRSKLANTLMTIIPHG